MITAFWSGGTHGAVGTLRKIAKGRGGRGGGHFYKLFKKKEWSHPLRLNTEYMRVTDFPSMHVWPSLRQKAITNAGPASALEPMEGNHLFAAMS